MKGKTLKPSILSALMFLFLLPAFSQGGNGSNYESVEDSITCGKHVSAYRTFFKLELYDDAYGTWWKAFSNCPAISEMMYLDGVTMYRHFIEEAPEGPKKEGLIDTLMLIYDQRMEYFGGEGNVLGRKARDLLTYRGEDMEQVYKAYEMLHRSIELEGTDSKDATMLLLISTGIMLKNEGKMDDIQVIEDYFMLSGILDQLEGKSSRWAKARATIDEMMLKEDILSCEVLNGYYEPQFEQNKEDKIFLEKVISFYTAAGCERSDIYVSASENLYRIEPGPESAHNLAIMFIAKNDFPKAIEYLHYAVIGENIDKEILAEWFYELAVLSSATKDYCEAIKNAREAILNKNDYGKAYISLGDAIIASRSNLGDDFEQRTAFWVAADMYAKAASVDPSVAAEANQKINDYAGQYPHNEDVFFRDLKDGDSYTVAGCINESTTVRSRK
jgi:tetratricopeptide (TPR) repeat protein